MKKAKSKSNLAHTPKSSYGMGDYYGTGIKQPIGKVRDVMGYKPGKSTKMGKPPKSLA